MKKLLCLLVLVLQFHCKSAGKTSESKEVFVSDNVKLEATITASAPSYGALVMEVTNRGKQTIQCHVTISADLYNNGQKMGEVILNENFEDLKAGETRSMESAASQQLLVDLGIPGTKYVRIKADQASPSGLDPIDVFFDCKDQKKNPLKFAVEFLSNLFKKKTPMQEAITGLNLDGLNVLFMTSFPVSASIEMSITNLNDKPVRCETQIKYDFINNGSNYGSGNLYYTFERIAPKETATLPQDFAKDKLVATGVPGTRFNTETLSKDLKCKFL